MEGQQGRSYSELLLKLSGREPIGFGWRVALPASILGFLSSFFRKRVVRQRLQTLRFSGATPSRGRTVVVAGAIAPGAICGLTDAKSPAEPTDDFDWIPTVTMDSTASDPEADLGPIVVRIYDVQNVLDRLDVDARLIPDMKENLKLLIAEILQSKRVAPPQTSDSSADANHASAPSREATFTLDGARLTVQATEGLHAELAENLKAWEQSGLGQISVDCRFVTAGHDIAAAAGVSWQYQEAFSADTEQSLPTGPSTGKPVVRAGASVNEFLPVVVAALSKAQAEALVRLAQGERRVNVLQAPKVTMFNGQRATVMDISQTPFVVGVRKNVSGAREPRIRVFEEGTKITLRPIHSSDRRQVHLEGRLDLSSIGEVRTAKAVVGGETTALEIPRAKRCRIDVACTVNDQDSVLIGCVPAYEEKKILYVLLTIRTVWPDLAAAN